ncbi:uncharacterized protein METZ01_LOCUS484405, partial [marine metagenome]
MNIDDVDVDILRSLEIRQSMSHISKFYFNHDDREYILISYKGLAMFIDISNPYKPKYISRLLGYDGKWTDIRYINDHIYIK